MSEAIEAQRMDITKIAPDVYKHLLAIEQEIARHIEPKLHHLLKLRASQINGCAFCLGMHTDEALRDGEKVERLMLLDAWSESSAFSDKERAALAWIEEVTLIAESGASKEAFDDLKTHFSDDEIGWLTLVGTMINAWNRIAISSRGQYDRKPLEQTTAAAANDRVAEPA
jgi:AhpD family alkylhydroperoxidase